MDEPLSNLDAQLRTRARAELADLHRTLGSTVLYATHDQVEAMTMGHRIAVMSAGVLQQCDTPQQVYARPTNVFVASFIGSPAMNLLSADIEPTPGGVRVRCGELTCVVPTNTPMNARTVTLGIRPEHFRDRPDGDAAGETEGVGRISGLVRFVEPHGADQFVMLVTAAGLITVRLRPEVPVRVGDQLRVSTDLVGAHLFEATSGQRLATIEDGRSANLAVRHAMR